MVDPGNDTQARVMMENIAEAAASAAMLKLKAQQLSEPKAVADVPAPLKWAGGIIAGLFAAGTATLAFWLVTSVSEMQVTLARMDERMASGTIKDARFDELNRRVTILESYHEGGRAR